MNINGQRSTFPFTIQCKYTCRSQRNEKFRTFINIFYEALKLNKFSLISKNSQFLGRYEGSEKGTNVYLIFNVVGKEKNEVEEFYNLLKEPEIREKKLEIGSSYT